MSKKIDKIANSVRRLDSVYYHGVSNLDIVKECIMRRYQGVFGRAPTEAEMTEALLRADDELIVVFGVAYESEAAACRANTVNHKSVNYQKNNMKLTLEEAISRVKKLEVEAGVVVMGVQYSSNAAACAAHSVGSHIVGWYMREKQLSLEDAIKVVKLRILGRETYLFDKVYESEAAACRAHGVIQTSVRNRMEIFGETFEEAVTAIKQNANGRSLVIFGVKHTSEAAVCRFYEINQSSVRNRMKDRDESLEQAISHFLKRKEEKEAKAPAQQRTPKHEPQNQIHR